MFSFVEDDFKTDNDFRYACLILNAQVVLINGMDNAVLVPQEWMKNFTNNPQINVQQTNQSVTQTSQLSNESMYPTLFSRIFDFRSISCRD